MVDKETMQDTSVSMDTSGLDPDSMAGIQGSTSRVESTLSTTSSSSDKSSSDGETGGVCSGQVPSKALDDQGLTDTQIQALVALGVPKSLGAGDGSPDMLWYYEDISADEGEVAQVATAEALAEAASNMVEGGVKPSTSSGPKQKQGQGSRGKQWGTSQGQSCSQAERVVISKEGTPVAAKQCGKKAAEKDTDPGAHQGKMPDAHFDCISRLPKIPPGYGECCAFLLGLLRSLV